MQTKYGRKRAEAGLPTTRPKQVNIFKSSISAES